MQRFRRIPEFPEKNLIICLKRKSDVLYPAVAPIKMIRKSQSCIRLIQSGNLSAAYFFMAFESFFIL